MKAAQGGNDAESAGVVAAFGDLHERGVGGGGLQARRIGVVDPLRTPDRSVDHGGPALDRGDDLRNLPGSKGGVDFRDLPAQVGVVPLGQASGHDEPALDSVRGRGLEAGHFQNRVDRLLLGPVDERAGIHHDHVGGRHVGGNQMPPPLQRSQHHLGIDEILRAAQADKADAPGLAVHARAGGQRNRLPGRFRGLRALSHEAFYLAGLRRTSRLSSTDGDPSRTQ